MKENDADEKQAIALAQTKSNAITPEVMMTADEARLKIEAIEYHTANICTLLLELDDRQGWKALGMDLGADDYLTKPCTVEELLGAIAVRLEKQAALLSRFATSAQPVPKPPPTDTASIAAHLCIFPSVPQLSKVFDLIEASYHRPITVEEVAQAVGYSPSYLTNLVRKQTGQTLYRWIVKRRMAQAYSLLLETDQTVEQIAEAVGYYHTVHFFRQFRQLHGTTPQAWRSARRYGDQHKQNLRNG